jgi:hypothetical protein
MADNGKLYKGGSEPPRPERDRRPEHPLRWSPKKVGEVVGTIITAWVAVLIMIYGTIEFFRWVF